ncbi:MAG: hypothetical protein ACLPVY_00650 [Acidimicrobiia bacterium]
MVGGGRSDPAAVAAEYDAAGASAVFLDAEWFFVYPTREFRRWDNHRLLPGDPRSHWFGPEVTAYMRQAYRSGHSRRHTFLILGPGTLFDTPDGRDVLRRRVDPSLADLVDAVNPTPPPVILSGTGTEILYGGVRSEISILGMRLHDSSGRHLGYVLDYRPTAGMSQVFSALALADLRHLDRMTAVARPDRRPAAILFADLEASG